MRGFDNLPQGGGHNDAAKIEELVELFDLKSAQRAFVALRFLPSSMLPMRRHWIQIKTKTGTSSIPKMCSEFDPDNPDTPLPGRKCPYCKLPHGKPEEGYPAKLEEHMYANVLVRDLQDSLTVNPSKYTKEEKETGFKSMNSKSVTPVRVLRMPLGVARRIKEMAEHNKGKPVYDLKMGMDVLLKYNPKAAPTDMYRLDRGDGERTPLTKEEQQYLIFDLEDADSIYDAMGRLDNARALAEFKKMKVISSIEEGEEEEEEEDDFSPSGRGKKAGKNAGGKKSRYDEEEEELDEEEEEDEDLDDEEEEEERRPSKKQKPAAKKKRFADEDDDLDEEEEEEDDLDDEEEEEERRPSKKQKPAAKKKPSRYDDEEEEEEDLDEEEEDEDEDEDERRPARKPKASGKPKPAAKKKSRYDDEEEDLDDDEEEEEEEDEEERRPARKPKPKVKPKATAKKKPSRYEEDDDLDEEEEEEEEEEERRPVRKPKATGKKRPVRR